MDTSSLNAIKLLEATSVASEDLSRLSSWLRAQKLPEVTSVSGVRVQVRPTCFIRSLGQVYVGVMEWAVYINLQDVMHNDDKAQGIVWRLELYWGEPGWLIEAEVSVLVESSRCAEDGLHFLPDRIGLTLEDGLEELRASSLDLAGYGNSLYEVVRGVR